MPRKTKLAKGRLDKYYWLAKEQGYKSRAAFKLIQINKRFKILQKAKCCVDLCAAPGGWTQVCAKFMPISSLIVAVDLVKMQSIRGCQTLQGDITNKKTETAIKRVLNDWEADCVFNDGAPNVGGTWSKDAYGQCELSLYALRFATKVLKEGGTFVTKVFRSSDYNALLWVCQQLFKTVTPFKPSASRMSSAETFFVCEGFLHPDKIDPRLLDPKFVFKNIEDVQSQLKNVLSKKYGKKPNRAGYEDGITSLYRELPVRDWIESDQPVVLLGKYNKLSFNESDTWLLENTPFEIKEMCADLKLLGKGDFRSLLKWRLKVKKVMDKDKIKDTVDPTDEETIDDLDDETKLKLELEAQKKNQEKLKKKERKNRRAQKLKARQRMALSTNDRDFVFNDPEIFMATSVKDQEMLDILMDGAYETPESSEAEDSDEDLDDMELLEKNLDIMYRQYKEKKGQKVKLKVKDIQIEDIAEEDVANLSDGKDEDVGPLKQSLEKKEKSEKVADDWFSNDVFNDVVESDEDENLADDESEEDDEKENEEDDETMADDESEEDDDAGTLVVDRKRKCELDEIAKKADEQLTYKQQRQQKKDTRSRRRRLEQEEEQKRKKGDYFEEVSADEDWSSDDMNSIAEVLAMGKEMLTKRKRQKMIDNSYNRYTFDDEGCDLPAWFEEEEKQHNRPSAPVTKEQVQEYKQYLKSVNARPIKKVAEAKARKKRKAMKAWEKLKKQASTIVESGEMNERQKSKAVQKLYNKMKTKNQKKTVKLITTKKGSRMQRKGGNAKGAKTIRVDRRMRKDARRDKMKKKRGEKRGRSGKKSDGKQQRHKRRKH